MLQGSRDKKALATLEEQFTVWPYEAEQPEDFVRAAHLYAGLRWKGVTVPAADCLIAAVAQVERIEGVNADLSHRLANQEHRA